MGILIRRARVTKDIHHDHICKYVDTSSKWVIDGSVNVIKPIEKHQKRSFTINGSKSDLGTYTFDSLWRYGSRMGSGGY